MEDIHSLIYLWNQSDQYYGNMLHTDVGYGAWFFLGNMFLIISDKFQRHKPGHDGAWARSQKTSPLRITPPPIKDTLYKYLCRATKLSLIQHPLKNWSTLLQPTHLKKKKKKGLSMSLLTCFLFCSLLATEHPFNNYGTCRNAVCWFICQ